MKWLQVQVTDWNFSLNWFGNPFCLCCLVCSSFGTTNLISHPNGSSTMADRLLSLFVRHGATGMNKNHQFRGPLNPPLNEDGIQDAQSLKEKFRNLDIGEAYTSDKLRSQQTANTVLEPHDIEPIVDPNL